MKKRPLLIQTLQTLEGCREVNEKKIRGKDMEVWIEEDRSCTLSAHSQ